MSDYQHKPNSGSLFKNDKREKDTHPHAKGSALIDGVEYWVSAWTNDGNNGKYQGLKFQKKDEAHDNGVQQARDGIVNSGGKTAADFEEDDTDLIPF
jgi:hypothetical protein